MLGGRIEMNAVYPALVITVSLIAIWILGKYGEEE